MINETIRIKTSWGVDGMFDLKGGINILMRKGLKLWHIFSDWELPFIVSKKQIKGLDFNNWGDKTKRFIVVSYVYNVPKSDKDKFAWFSIYEDDAPKSFKRCLDNLEVL